jgi:GST-like protein
MIDLYTWTTPNGFKISIALEELALPYKVVPIDIGRGAQFGAEFLRISPNNKIPAIVDHEGPAGRALSLFESGAILMYLAEKTGRLMPSEPAKRWAATEWLFFQMASIGPMLGQAGHFRNYAPEKIPYAVDRYTNEAKRLWAVLDRRLAEHEYLADEYSIADIAVFPWLGRPDVHGVELAEYPHVGRWREAIAARPAVQRGRKVPDVTSLPATDPQARENLFGNKQYERR